MAIAAYIGRLGERMPAQRVVRYEAMDLVPHVDVRRHLVPLRPKS